MSQITYRFLCYTLFLHLTSMLVTGLNVFLWRNRIFFSFLVADIKHKEKMGSGMLLIELTLIGTSLLQICLVLCQDFFLNNSENEKCFNISCLWVGCSFNYCKNCLLLLVILLGIVYSSSCSPPRKAHTTKLLPCYYITVRIKARKERKKQQQPKKLPY